MTGVLDTVVTAPETAAPQRFSASPVTTPREAWRRARLPVVLGGIVILVAVLQTILTGAVGVDRLDPDAAGPEGGRALAALLRDHGVDVRVVDVPGGGADTTVFYAAPALAALVPGSLEASVVATEVVVVEPGRRDLAALRTRIVAADEVEEEVRDPACGHPDAVAAGAVRMGGTTFGAPTDAVACYASRGGATFVEEVEGGRRTTALGSATFMTNERLGQDGNAALALRLLTRHPTVEWVYPRSLPVDEGERRGLLSLLPHRVLVLIAESLVVVLLLALWRGRRLGPVVVEPLPVVVRAAEAVEGRARLYEAAQAREAAANALRAGLRDRLVRVLGLAPDADPPTLVAAVTARARTRAAVDVGDLLYGPPPADDAALVRLADQLDQLDSEVRAL